MTPAEYFALFALVAWALREAIHRKQQAKQGRGLRR